MYYKGNAKVNLAGYWKKGLSSPLWTIMNMEPENAIELYLKRMKIEQSFKDLKSLLHVDKLMNKKRENMEKVIALSLIAYTIGLLVGEKIRDELYRGEKKWNRYSGLFIMCKRKVVLEQAQIDQVLNLTFRIFLHMIRASPVPSREVT